MPSGRFFPLLLALALLPAPALADGKVFRRGIAEMPPIPDQQAVIAWDAATSTETLAIETRFAAPGLPPSAGPSSGSGDGAPFAWVVPLPGSAAPQISPATSGLFPTIRQVFQPRVIDSTSPDGLFFTIPLALVLLLGVWLTRIQKVHPLVSTLLILLGFTCVGGLLLPTLGTARSSAGGPAPRGVELLERSLVGSYDVAVIGAGDAKDSGHALAAWLKEEGFGLPAAAEPVLADYAARKWVFAAVKLRPDPASKGRSHLTPHPLVFRFKSQSPVYPMRLTGLDNGPLSLDLYVFGSQRAQAAGMAEVRCDECRRGSEYEVESSWYRAGGTLAVVHPALSEIAGTQPIATKLSGTLTPGQQSTDLAISWAPYRELGRVKHSPRSAVYGAVEKSAAILSAMIVLLVIIGAAARKDGAWVVRKLGWALAPALAVGLVVWAMTPTVPIVPDGRNRLRDRSSAMFDLTEALGERVRHNYGGAATATPPTIENIRAIAAELVNERKLPAREEDSPQNYRIVPATSGNGFDLLTYNAFGAPIPLNIWPGEPKRH
jgi:hypothetical protein